MISENDLLTELSANFLIGGKLGSGKDGDVVEYSHKFTSERFALKCIKLTKNSFVVEYEMEIIKKQIDLFKKQTIKLILNPHPNIARIMYFCISEDNTQFYIFMEKMKDNLSTEIKQRIMDNLKYFSIEEFKEITVSLIKAFSYLQHIKMAHRDIKPDNLMFAYDGTIKIVDLGESCFGLDLRETFSIEIQGTLPYLAPELKNMYEENLLESKEQTNVYKCDVYSLGIVFLQIACLKKTSYIKGINSSQGGMSNKQQLLLDEVENRYGMCYKLIFEKMLKENPSNRPTFTELNDLIPNLDDNDHEYEKNRGNLIENQLSDNYNEYEENKENEYVENKQNEFEKTLLGKNKISKKEEEVSLSHEMENVIVIN